jgi:hypothetical protein
MWTVVMFASLPHAVNVFSKTSDQCNIVAAFLHFNTLQAVQFVQYTDTTNIDNKLPVLHLMEAAAQ